MLICAALYFVIRGWFMTELGSAPINHGTLDRGCPCRGFDTLYCGDRFSLPARSYREAAHASLIVYISPFI